jgi:hypothetical protein
MFGLRYRLNLIRPLFLALLVLCLAPLHAMAETVVVRNDCAVPLVIQGASVARGVLFRGRPYQLKVGETSPGINLPGNKIITVCDPRTNRIILQQAIPPSNDDQTFLIVPDGRGVKLDLKPNK